MKLKFIIILILPFILSGCLNNSKSLNCEYERIEEELVISSNMNFNFDGSGNNFNNGNILMIYNFNSNDAANEFYKLAELSCEEYKANGVDCTLELNTNVIKINYIVDNQSSYILTSMFNSKDTYEEIEKEILSNYDNYICK